MAKRSSGSRASRGAGLGSDSDLLRQLNLAVVVAVVTMWMVKVSINEVVYVVSVRNCLVSTVWSMNVVRIMT